MSDKTPQDHESVVTEIPDPRLLAMRDEKRRRFQITYHLGYNFLREDDGTLHREDD
jgi:hypothetical protein